MKPLTVLASTFLLASLLLAWFVESRSPAPVPLTPTLTGEIEYCLTCHGDLPEISPAHAVQTFGCVLCHGGERLALDADLAHSSLRGGDNPSDLAVVEASCGGGDCHGGDPAAQRDHIQRVMTSIQVNYTGAITSIRCLPRNASRERLLSLDDPCLSPLDDTGSRAESSSRDRCRSPEPKTALAFRGVASGSDPPPFR